MKSLLPWLLLLASCHYRSQDRLDTLNNLPAFSLLLPDSTTILQSRQIANGKALVFIYFETSCPLCREETKNILQHIDSFSNVQLYFLTPMSLGELNQYNSLYHLSDYRNIIVCKDYEHSFAKLFRPRVVPYMAVYNSQRKLVKIFKGKTSVHEFLDALQM